MRVLCVAVALFAANSLQTAVSDLPFPIDIGQLPTGQLTAFCQGETGTCSILCSGNTLANTCLQTPSLSWTCTCRSNNSEPGLQYYDSSMFSFLCKQAYGQCMSVHAGDLMAQQTQCVSSINPQCGTLQTNALLMAASTAPGSITPTPTTPVSTVATASAQTTSSTHNSAPSVAVFGQGAAALVAIGMLAQAL